MILIGVASSSHLFSFQKVREILTNFLASLKYINIQSIKLVLLCTIPQAPSYFAGMVLS